MQGFLRISGMESMNSRVKWRRGNDEMTKNDIDREIIEGSDFSDCFQSPETATLSATQDRQPKFRFGEDTLGLRTSGHRFPRLLFATPPRAGKGHLLARV